MTPRRGAGSDQDSFHRRHPSRRGGAAESTAFRYPHHGVRRRAGRGRNGSPAGEVPRPSGVLFLDELPEFSRTAMEALRQPLEDAQVTISRVNASPDLSLRVYAGGGDESLSCGYLGTPHPSLPLPPNARRAYLAGCPARCSIGWALAYRGAAGRVRSADGGGSGAESSAVIRERVNAARARQLRRYQGTPVTCNAQGPAPASAGGLPDDSGGGNPAAGRVRSAWPVRAGV